MSRYALHCECVQVTVSLCAHAPVRKCLWEVGAISKESKQWASEWNGGRCQTGWSRSQIHFKVLIFYSFSSFRSSGENHRQSGPGEGNEQRTLAFTSGLLGCFHRTLGNHVKSPAHSLEVWDWVEVSSFRREFTALHRGFRIPTQGFLGEILGEVSRLALSSLVLWVKQFWFFYFGSKSTKFLIGKGRTCARPWRGGLEGAHGSVSFIFPCSFLRYSLVWLEYCFKSHVGNLMLVLVIFSLL